jgi:hypothetical protein
VAHVTLSPVASRNRARAKSGGAHGQLTDLVREGGGSLRCESRCTSGFVLVDIRVDYGIHTLEQRSADLFHPKDMATNSSQANTSCT